MYIIKGLLFFLFIANAQHAFSENAITDSLKLILPSQSGAELVQTYSELSWEYKNIDVDSAYYFAQLSIDESKKDSNCSPKCQKVALTALANAYEAKGILDSAYIIHEKALQISFQLNDSVGIANTYNNLGILHDLMSQYKASLEQYYSALKIYERLGAYPMKEAMVLGNIGIVYKKMKEYGTVVSYYEKALAIYEKEGSTFGKTVTKGNLASVLLLTGDYEGCIKYAEDASEGYKSLGYIRYIPYMMHNKALALDSLQRTSEAESYYEEAIHALRHENNYYELASIYNDLANNQFLQGKYPKVINYTDSAIFYTEVAKTAEFGIRALKLQAKALLKMGAYQQASGKLLQYIDGNDSLFQEKKTKAILELQTKYETEKKQQQIQLQQAELVQKDLTIQRDKVLITSCIVLLILLVVIVYLVRNKMKWKQAKILEEAKAQAQKEQISVVISSQEKERKRFAEDIHDGFGQLISILKLNISSLSKTGTDSSGMMDRQKIFDASLSLINEMYAELRNICFNLMPQTLVKFGLAPALREFAERINQTGVVQVVVSVYNMDNRLMDLQEISLYRITQEVTNNILKYAEATKIEIQLVRDEDELTLTIEDNGNGFDPNILLEGKGNGWKNIKARSGLINADFEFDSKPNVKGSTFILNMPIKAQAPSRVNTQKQKLVNSNSQMG